MTSPWRPISEYPTTPGVSGPVVLARDNEKMPLLVAYLNGHFVICPGIPIMYADRNSGTFMTADHVVEFMEIPE